MLLRILLTRLPALLLLALSFMLVACSSPLNNPTATPLPATTVPTVAPPTVAPATPMARPIIGFNPQAGGPGTVVELFGAGYQPGAMVAIRLGLPAPVGEVLAGVKAGTDGRWNTRLTMPANLPSGEPITASKVFLVAMDDQNMALASAPFSFTPGIAPPPRTAASETVRSFLDSFFSASDPTVYLADPLLAEVNAGRPLEAIVGTQPGFQGFTVYEPDDRPSEVLFVRAEISYGDAVIENTFTLVVVEGQWRINGISVTGSRPLPGAEQDWREAASGDLNADGIGDQLRYRPVEIRLQGPVGFSDPSIVHVMIAGEVVMQQEALPGERTRRLLHLTLDTLMAEDHQLAGFSADRPAGFLVVVYGGERYSYYITPLTSSGMPYNQAFEVYWNEQEQGYRTR